MSYVYLCTSHGMTVNPTSNIFGQTLPEKWQPVALHFSWHALLCPDSQCQTQWVAVVDKLGILNISHLDVSQVPLVPHGILRLEIKL